MEVEVEALVEGLYKDWHNSRAYVANVIKIKLSSLL